MNARIVVGSLSALLFVGCATEPTLSSVDAGVSDRAGDDAPSVDSALPPTDAGRADVEHPDVGPTDVPVADIASGDANPTDLAPTDSSLTDTDPTDRAAVDAPAADATVVDATVVDATVVDGPRADATTADVPTVDVQRDVAPADVGSDGGATDAGPLVPVRYGAVATAVAGCAVPVGDPRREAVETRCDGVDNDCDGHTDVLMPTGPNACSTGLSGVCGAGWAACEGTTRVCQAPAATPEVTDGRDNDCNGALDDVPTSGVVRSRALLLVPEDLWGEGTDEVNTVGSILEQWGVAYDRPAVGTSIDQQLPSLAAGYALVVIPGYVGAYDFPVAARTALEAFVRAGGVVVVQKPVTTTAEPSLPAFLGLTRTARRLDATALRFVAPAPATSALDSPEERSLMVSEDPATQPSEVYTLVPDPAAGVTVLARAYAGATDLGAAVTRRPLGRGAIYAVGHDLHGFRHYRCYINCFEPSGDVLGLFLRDALREGAAGHVVLKHTVPGAEDSLLTLTHDVDAPEAATPGAWGAAGAAQMASVESARGARGTYYVTTDYINGYWQPDTVRYLCSLGMCPPGAHSVTHRSQGTLPMGTCTETQATYTPFAVSATTLCGEVRVSLDLLGSITGARPRAWRSPYLTIHPGLFDLLAAEGVVSDSSYAIGDFKTNLPISLARTGIYQGVFHRRAMYEHLISLEDGIGTNVGGVVGRIELQENNFPFFFGAWSYAALRNAANGAFSVALIHPSAGVGVPATNIGVKFTAADRLLAMAGGAGIRTDLGVDALADFWRGREGATVDASFDTAGGYRGTLVVGAAGVTNLTLEFGDRVTTFTCPACGPTTVVGRRVVLRSALAPGLRATFTAR